MSPDKVVQETYEFKGPEIAIETEYIAREDWEDLRDSCPECDGTEFNHVRYRGGQYGLENGIMVERTDYWFEEGSLYTACMDCNETLYKHPAYDIIEDWMGAIED